MGCLMESGISTVLGPELVQQVEDQIKSLVLATDITRQKEFLDRLTVRDSFFFFSIDKFSNFLFLFNQRASSL